MKILITSDCYVPTINGVVTSIINLKTGLEALGHEVRVLTLSSTGKSEIKGTDYYIGSVSGEVIYPDVRIKIAPCKKMMRQIYDWKPDIVHSQTEFSTFPIAKAVSKKLNIPLLHTYHTVYEDYTHYFSPSKTVGKKVVRQFTRVVSKHCDAIVAPTTKVQSMLMGYGLNSPVKVTPSGIDLSKFKQEISQAELDALREELSIPKDYKILISVSRVSKEKNIEELITYLANSELKKTVFLIVGDGPRLEDLKALVHSLHAEEKILFTGMVAPEKIPLYYRLADVFLSASNSETQGLTYIEALASGTPLLCRKDDCLKDILEEGKNGFLYETEEKFQAQLAHYCCIPATKEQGLLVTAIQSSVSKFSIEHFAKSIEGIYIELINNRTCYGGRGGHIGTIGSIASLLLCGVLTFYGYQSGWFTSVESLQELVTKVGVLAPLLFIVLQITQVVFPIIPGGLGCLAGVILFGGVHGFLYNYIGICIGSLLVFAISKSFGQRVMHFLFSRQLIHKYQNWTSKKDRFNKMFAWAIFLPVAPDDFLCYLAGTTQMSWRYFTGTILTGKILSIAAYSFGLTVVWQRAVALLETLPI